MTPLATLSVRGVLLGATLRLVSFLETIWTGGSEVTTGLSCAVLSFTRGSLVRSFGELETGTVSAELEVASTFGCGMASSV